MNATNDAKHLALRHFVIQARVAAGMTQAEVARRMGLAQSIIAKIELGDRRIGAVELTDLAQAIGFDPLAAIGCLKESS